MEEIRFEFRSLQIVGPGTMVVPQTWLSYVVSESTVLQRLGAIEMECFGDLTFAVLKSDLAYRSL